MNIIYEVPLTLTMSNKSLAGSTVCIRLVFLCEPCDEWEPLLVDTYEFCTLWTANIGLTPQFLFIYLFVFVPC